MFTDASAFVWYMYISFSMLTISLAGLTFLKVVEKKKWAEKYDNLGLILLIFFTILFLVSFLFLLPFWVLGSIFLLAPVQYILYVRIYKHRLYKILGLLAKEHGVTKYFSVKVIIRRLREKYPKKYKSDKQEALEVKIGGFLNMMVSEKITEKALLDNLDDSEKINAHRGWHYRRKPGLTLRKKAKRWLSIFSPKFE